MVTFYESIPPNMQEWALKQELFFVATAPMKTDGHVNVSPKGLRGSFHVVDANHVWYEDLSGSGSETVSHLRENGRITVMFTAFEGPPRILRLWGTGIVHEFGTPEYDALLPPEVRRPGSRAAIVVDVHKVGASCGYAVPLYTFKAHRPTLVKFLAGLEKQDQQFDARLESAAAKEDADGGYGGVPPHSEKGLKAYWILKNTRSIDDYPSLLTAHVSGRTPVHAPRTDEEEGFASPKWGQDKESSRGGSIITNTMPKGIQCSDWAKLGIAFSAGFAVAAVYMKVVVRQPV